MTSHKLTVFVSYSHTDEAWLKRVQVHLKPLARDGRLELWDDTRIKTGERWREAIKAALERADVVVLLISADFYASDFIANDELPPLLEAARSERELVIAGLHISYSRFDRDQILSEYQTVNTPDQPIEALQRPQQEKIFDKLARRIEELLCPPRVDNHGSGQLGKAAAQSFVAPDTDAAKDVGPGWNKAAATNVHSPRTSQSMASTLARGSQVDSLRHELQKLTEIDQQLLNDKDHALTASGNLTEWKKRVATIIGSDEIYTIEADDDRRGRGLYGVLRNSIKKYRRYVETLISPP
jgi:TIR domain